MQKFLPSILAVGIYVIPIAVTSIAQPSWGETPNPPKQAAEKLLEQAIQKEKKQEYQEAIPIFEKVLVMIQEQNGKKLEALILNELGFCNDNLGEKQKALEFYNQALPLRRAVGDRSGEASTLNNIGGIYDDLGEKQKALEFYNQALPLRRVVGDHSGEAITLNNIGGVYNDLGEKQKALEFLNQALPLRRMVGDRSGEATTLNNIGAVYADLGEKQKALELYNQALPLERAVDNRSGEAFTLNNIGLVYSDLGEKQKALEFLNQALPLERAVGDRSGEASTLNNIGLVYADLGEKQKALEFYNQALPLRRVVGDRSGEAITLNNIGAVYSALREKQKALKFYNQSLPLERAVGDRSGEANTLSNIGAVYSALGEKQKALEFYNQALSLEQAVGDYSGKAFTLGNRGILFQNINQPDAAIIDLETSLQIFLEMRRSLLLLNRQKFLQQYGWSSALVNVLIQQKQYDQAFTWVNLFTTSDLAEYNRLINAKVANPEAQQAINNLNQKNQLLESQRRQLLNRFSETSAQKIRETEAQVYTYADQISRKFPEVAELFETTPRDIEKLKSSIPVGTVVIQPVLLNSFLSNIPSSLAIFILTKNKVDIIPTSINPTEFDRLLTQYLKQLEDDSDADYAENSIKLYDILIRPVESTIQKLQPQQLSIIPTGNLRYLPFETLKDSKTDKYLIQKYPINYLSRISTHALSSISSQETAHQQKTAVLAFGNPVPREPQNLPGAEIEVKKIKQIIPGSEAYIGSEATLAKFKSQALRFTLLHLATHGCFQNEDCKLLKLRKNSLLFADGQFDIADAALLGLHDTELLTLSACETAKEINNKGVGIAGVAYIFERAGAKAVLASLWSVDDEKTKTLMINFYDNLHQGMSKAEALQKAKLNLIDRHPFYWSSFLLIGDPR